VAADLAPSTLELERIPEGATLLDLRPLASFQTWHPPAAPSLEFPHALTAFPALPRPPPCASGGSPAESVP